MALIKISCSSSGMKTQERLVDFVVRKLLVTEAKVTEMKLIA